ncbi:ABC transporter substrate-binding protein [Microvirga tunisiensis]|uniref:ABC transporter substrate-binding protein n=1 Tax=Microvirga tunisiensis TaxID=2108360 RepID=UPI001FCE7C7B|nr:ABC transporter substrate-binding protein [Microvirga tunisiensis]
MRETGYVEGQNVVIDHSWAQGHYDRLPALAAELVSRKVDVIVSVGGSPTALAAKGATSTIPILFRSGGDAVELGFVASLARPGGNPTGVSLLADELTPKRLELLSELVPQAGVIALLVNPDLANTKRNIPIAEDFARARGLQLPIVKATAPGEIDDAFASLPSLHAGALVVSADPFLSNQREQLVALASRHAVPAIDAWREFAAAGGLISYGSSLTAAFRLVGIYVGKIIKGANPADMPVQQPTTFELVINLKTARALGLNIPQQLLAEADELIGSIWNWPHRISWTGVRSPSTVLVSELIQRRYASGTATGTPMVSIYLHGHRWRCLRAADGTLEPEARRALPRLHRPYWRGKHPRHGGRPRPTSRCAAWPELHPADVASGLLPLRGKRPAFKTLTRPR